MQLFIGLLLGGIGYVYFHYGRKRPDLVSLLVGLALMIAPYFVESMLWLGVISATLMALPFVLKKLL